MIIYFEVFAGYSASIYYLNENSDLNDALYLFMIFLKGSYILSLIWMYSSMVYAVMHDVKHYLIVDGILITICKLWYKSLLNYSDLNKILLTERMFEFERPKRP